MKKIFAIMLLLLVAIQFVPYGKNHVNPKVISEPQWDSPKTRALFMKACADCHSNETKWPAYSSIAPVSWIVYNHVIDGREHLNISAWGHQKKNKGKDAVEELEEGDMPLLAYVVAHPEAKLTDAETKLLMQGLKNTFGEDD